MELPLDRLRFLCTAAPGTRMPSRGSSDLWLVGGDLAQWRCSRGAPAMDAEVRTKSRSFGEKLSTVRICGILQP